MTIPSEQFCPACYPAKVRSHFESKLEILIDVPLSRVTSKKPARQLPRYPAWCSFTHWFYRFMELVHVVRRTKEFHQKDHYPRSWVIIQEAQKRGIPIESISMFGRVATYYSATFGSKKYYFDALPSRFLNYHLDNKAFTKTRLLQQGFPASQGAAFWNSRRAFHFGKKLGFPLAVKPTQGTHAFHVTAPVNTDDELRAAIALAKKYQPNIIVEKYLEGSLYRVTIINFDHVFVARRIAPNIVGDGVHSVRELIGLKNTDQRRGITGQKDTTLHKIPINENTHAALARVGRTLDFVPAMSETVFLHNKKSIGSGGDIIEETDLLHPENKEMFRRAARVFGTDLIGFDVIADDLAKPYNKQSCGIIEANSIPMLDFHHNPSIGTSHDVAGALWDAILADKRVRYLYPHMLPERSLYTRLMWHFLDITAPIVRDFLVRFRIVRVLSKRQRFLVGILKPNISVASAIAFLKMNGFEFTRPGWVDYGEINGLRKLLDAKRQCHIRFFADNEVRAHIEYAPEARPIAHLLEKDFSNPQAMITDILGAFIDPPPSRKKQSLRTLLTEKNKAILKKYIKHNT